MTGYGKSIRSKLLNIAKKEGIHPQTILTRYFQERLLYRMSQTRFRNNFFLKGGALMYAHERFAARPTLDMDFLGSGIGNEHPTIVAAFKEICAVPYEEDAVAFDVDNITAQDITESKEYHGVRLGIPVKMDTISQNMVMDVGFGDVVTPGPVDLEYPLLLEHLPRPNILAYSLETVIAEKIHAVVDLAGQNSRMKDYYDLYRILTKKEYDNGILKEAIARTFENRHTAYDADTAFFRKGFADNPRMEVYWNAFMHKISEDTAVPFGKVVGFIQETLRAYWEDLSRD